MLLTDEADVLYQSPRTRVTRLRESDSLGPLILKEGIGRGSRERMRHERGILRRLSDTPGVPQLADEDAQSPSSIAMKDEGAVPLSSVFTPGDLDIDDLFRIARDLADLVARIHERGVLHKDINPNNVLVVGESRELVLLDYDLAAVFTHKRPSFATQRWITGTLPYLSPEQTGRTGRPVDHRADLYSLGATLYHLAVGTPPFGSDSDSDTLTLVHDHLAQAPTPPRTHRPALPVTLSEIILRLLEKEPDRRYQSATGLVHDLDLARRRWASGVPDPFSLGERDFPLRLSSPVRLVGRDRQIAELVDEFERVKKGTVRGVFLAGAPGVGKTSLMNELRAVADASNGWFVSGKFDQYHRGQESDAVARSVGALGLRILADTESESELATLRARVTAAVGPNASLLISVVPELTHLLDLPPAEDRADGLAPMRVREPGVDPFDAERRLQQSGLDFLRTVTSPSRPLILVMDDLQWSTSTPLGFIDLLLRAEDPPTALVLAAYRNTEVEATHPLSGKLSEWRALPVPPRFLTVENLPPPDLETLLTRILRLPTAPPRSLTQLVQARTGGNPFDTVELLNALRRHDVLSLKPEGWVWDETADLRLLDGENVIALVNARIDDLPSPTARLLETMSLLHGEISRDLLQTATGLSQQDLSVQLHPALDDGLLLMEPDGRTRFAHDRIQQAAYARISPGRGRTLRLGLARVFAASPEDRMQAAEQYQSVAEDIVDDEERQLAATLMHQAAEQQILASPATSLQLVDAALTLYVSPAEDTPDRFLGELHAVRHTALYRLGRLAEADEAFAAFSRYSPQVLDRVPTARNQIHSLCNRGLYLQALDLGMDLLVELGVDNPGEDLSTTVNTELDQVLRWLPTVDIEAESRRPVCTDPRIQATALVCHGMIPPGFFVNPMLSFWVTLLSLRLWSEHGPFAANYGTIGFVPIVMTSLREDYRTAIRLLDVVMKVGRAHGFDDHMFPTGFYSLLIEHWFHPLADDLDKARTIRSGLLKAGEIQFVSYTYTISAAAAWECYPTLEACLTEVESGLAFARQIGDSHCEAIFESYLPLIQSLRSGNPPDQELPDTTSNPMATCFLHTNEALRSVLFADLPACARHAEAAVSLVSAIDGHHHILWAHTLHAFAKAWQLGQADPDEADTLLAEVDEHLGWLERRAEDNPDNFAHLVDWIRAERAVARAEVDQAARFFDRALGGIGRHKRVWHHALICERAGRFYLAQEQRHVGELLLFEAWHRYQDWGAEAKADQLASSFPMLFQHQRSDPADPGSVKPTTSGEGPLANVDMLAVLRASQALSQETNLDQLQNRIVDVLGAITGSTAVRVLLWSPESHSWILSAAHDRQRPVSLEQPDAGQLLPLSALRYVDRTQSPLLVEDALTDPRFAKDPYFADMEHCSLLVVPIQKQGAPLAMLLMENRLSGSALDPGHLDTVLLISGQLATSIDNALGERFRSVVQHSAALTLVCDSQHALTYASAASADLLGSADSDLLGRIITELFHEDDRPEVNVHLLDATRGVSKPLECRIVTANQRIRWVEVAFTNLLTDPSVNGLVLRLQDITERRDLEMQLRHSQKMQSVGVLSSGIAHEINTPIQYVITNLRFLSKAFDDLLGRAPAGTGRRPSEELRAVATASPRNRDDLLDEIPQAITEALDGVSQVATIVQAMKAFGHPGSERMTPSDLNDAIRNTVLVATNEIKHVADVELSLGALPPVDCVLGDIKQVLLNLVVNATQAIKEAQAGSDRQGRITIRSRQDGPEFVVIEVTDTGTGISPQIADRVFDQFFTTKDVGIGTGQGLSLAYTLVHDRHHGTLSFTSELGEGTTFVIRLPIRQPCSGRKCDDQP